MVGQPGSADGDQLGPSARQEFHIMNNLMSLRCDTQSWNNGKDVPRLDLTSSTTPGLQIHKFDHTRTANTIPAW